MVWRLAGIALLVAALGGATSDVVSTSSMLSDRINSITIYSALLWFQADGVLTQFLSEQGSGSQQLLSRGAKILLGFPIWFALAAFGYLLVRLDPRRHRLKGLANARVGLHRRLAKLASYAVVGLAVLIVFLDATREHAAIEQETSTTLYGLWMQMALLSPSVGGSLSFLEPIATVLHYPAWLVLFYFGLALQYVSNFADARSRRTVSSGGEAHVQSEIASEERSEPRKAISAFKSALILIGIFSGIINVLMLTGAFFMLEVYDRVLPSQSVETLIALAVLVFILYSAQVGLDVIRNRMLVRVGNGLDAALSSRAFDVATRLSLVAGSKGANHDPTRDLDNVRGFISGPGPVVFFDLPWLPIYLAVIFALHPWLGWTATAGALVLVVLTFITEAASRRPTMAASLAVKSRSQLMRSARRNADTLTALGMQNRLRDQWHGLNDQYLRRQSQTSDVAGGLGSIAKGLRLMLQSTVLGVGAFLVILQEASAGVIIAGAILSARALAPIDLAITQWRGFVAARQSWTRLAKALELVPPLENPLPLPAPSKELAVHNVSATAPGDHRLILKNISFVLTSGQGVGIIGPSASGKSTLARLLVGAWQPLRGRITLDSASVSQWSSENLGQHVGYLPQTVELFSGSIAENISRYDPGATSESVIAAARAAGVHDLILQLPDGYQTQVGEAGLALSVGQRQRIALARALYGDPFLVVLDEPNSNLDAEGDIALLRSISAVRQRGGIVVVIAHRSSVLAAVDQVIALHGGQMIASGPRDEVIAQFRIPRDRVANTFKVVSESTE